MFCCSDGINPPPDVQTVKFDELAPQLQTGDIVLFTGATSSGAIIRLFDYAEFSHVGLVSYVPACFVHVSGIKCSVNISVNVA